MTEEKNQQYCARMHDIITELEAGYHTNAENIIKLTERSEYACQTILELKAKIDKFIAAVVVLTITTLLNFFMEYVSK